MKYGLSMTATHKLFASFVSIPEIDEAILYGSRAMGNFHPGSDIDIALKGALLDKSKLREIESKLEAMMLPFFIDVSIYHMIRSQELLQHIDEEGKTLYKRHICTCHDAN
ncbi:nucleotidyltransferase domain-containing protein [Chitinophaga pollutisoli]|uniref:Nucleotidyltransferase domain-containing protein n=1 Tax=Chitinophaga pollutisoli TaxID=3133966 RepID=A0ABZ2YKG0_9BACT